MNRKQWRGWVLTAAVLAVPGIFVSSVALGQVPANQDGRAKDANNRVGSGGVNDTRSGGGYATGNQIVTRNVTGGKEFRGPVGYRDPRAFTGPAGGGFQEDFVKNSSGVPTSFSGPMDANAARPFYGDRRAVAPPPGSMPEGFTGGYVGSTLNSPLSNSFGLGASPTLGLQTRTLNRDYLNEIDRENDGLNPAGNTANGFSTPTLFSPIAGANLSRGNNDFSNGLQGDRFSGQDTVIQQMQRELRDAAGIRTPDRTDAANGGDAAANNNGSGKLADPQKARAPGTLGQSLDTPLEAPADATLSRQTVSTSSLNNGPLNNGLNTQ